MAQEGRFGTRIGGLVRHLPQTCPFGNNPDAAVQIRWGVVPKSAFFVRAEVKGA